MLNNEVVSVSGRRAQILKHNSYPGERSFGSVQVMFEDTGEIKNLPDTLVRPISQDVEAEAVEITLPLQDQERLDTNEEVIARGLSTFIEVGNALLDIRDNRLYRARFSTFEDYCRERWEFSRQRANQLIGAAEVVGNLTTIVVNPPANEAQARELTTLTPDEQRLVWQMVTESAPDGKVTAAHVKSVVSLLTQVGYTGAIDGIDGIDIPIEQATPDHFKAAVTEETYERMARQQVYIADKQKPRTKLFDERGSLETVVTALDWARWEYDTAGRIVRLVLYVEEET